MLALGLVPIWYWDEDLKELYEEMLNKPMYVGCIDKTTPMVSYGCLCLGLDLM